LLPKKQLVVIKKTIKYTIRGRLQKAARPQGVPHIRLIWGRFRD